MTVKERIKAYTKCEGITIAEFEKSISVSNGYVNSISRSIGIDKINLMLEKYPNLNIVWLLTGKGEMLKSGETTPSSHINNDAIPPMEEAKPAPTQASNSELMLEKICQLSADNALLRHENEELKSENGVLKHEIEDLKNNRPLPASIPYDLARSSAPSLASEPDIEVYQGRYGNDKNNLKHL